MHEEIKGYSVEGIVGDEANVSKLKDSVSHFMEQGMRDDGFVPLLDMEPQYTQQYNPNEDRFEFKLTVYGAFVGKERAWRSAGVMGGRTILKATLPAK